MNAFRYKLIASILLCSINVSAQLIQSATMQDGAVVEKNHALAKNDTCTFISNGKADWKFVLFENHRRDSIIVLEASDTDTFCIPVTREKLNYWTFITVDRTVSESGSLEYLVGEVRAKKNDTIATFPIMLDVLPVRPHVESITWDSITLNPDNAYCINEIAHIKIFLESRDNNTERLTLMEEALGDYYGGEEYIRWNSFVTKINYEQEGEYITFDYLIDWACYIRVYVTNEFGGIYSEPALVNDYITDPYVLSVIEKYREKFTGINRAKIDQTDISLSVSDNWIEITAENEDIVAVRLIDSTGNILLSQRETASIDISNYPAGMYILICHTNENNIVSHKFIKR